MKSIVISIIIAGALIGGVFMLSNKSSGSGSANTNANNVSVVNGTQQIAIDVKGGYAPSVSTAKANMSTKLELKTNGTFDCSSGVSIAALGYTTHLPPSGTTEVDVPPQKAGTTIQGVCSMGMYNFAVNFN